MSGGSVAAPGDNRYAWSNPAHVFLMQALERDMLRLLLRHRLLPLTGSDILEVGCGRGYWIREWVKWGADPARVVGVDLSLDSIMQAGHLTSPATRLLIGDATALPFASNRFDLVLQSTLFTSILDASKRQAAAQELLRIVRPNGHIIWYDFIFNNPANPRVRGVPLREVRQLFAPYRPVMRRVTLAPPLARWLAPRSRFVCGLAATIPLLRTHCLATIQKS